MYVMIVGLCGFGGPFEFVIDELLQGNNFVFDVVLSKLYLWYLIL